MPNSGWFAANSNLLVATSAPFAPNTNPFAPNTNPFVPKPNPFVLSLSKHLRQTSPLHRTRKGQHPISSYRP